MVSNYVEAVRDIVLQFDPTGENRYFQFGSSVRKSSYRDIDLGVVGNSRVRKELDTLREAFEESTIPYTVDIVDFDEADQYFREFVLSHEPLLWIQ